MKVKKALLSLFLITVIYLSVLIWLDSKNHYFERVDKLFCIMPLLLAFSFVVFLVRYLRWYWLLMQSGYKTKFFMGFLIYFSGFAFTATPGKVGELIRVRYLAPLGIPPSKVVSAFLYERAFDLIVVLMLAALSISRLNVLLIAITFVCAFLGLVALLMFKPLLLTKVALYSRFLHANRLSKLIRTMRDGFVGCRAWINPRDISICTILGLLAWGLTSLIFVYLLNQLDVRILLRDGISIYPLAMLAGAASMLPGGMGSTEATLVGLLSYFGVTVGLSTLAAIGIRIATLWFSIVCGLISLLALEFKNPVHRFF